MYTMLDSDPRPYATQSVVNHCRTDGQEGRRLTFPPLISIKQFAVGLCSSLLLPPVVVAVTLAVGPWRAQRMNPLS
jgi:hypothetical protein